MNLIWLMLIFMLVFGTGVFDAFSERKAIADDLSSGRLCINEEADRWIRRGDFELNRAHCDEGVCGRHVTGKIDSDLFEAFIAKVSYERARLEMEIRGCPAGGTEPRSMTIKTNPAL